MKPTYTNASTIAAMCLENVEDPDRTALIFEDKRLSYRQLDEAVHTVARGLLGLGLDRGDKLGTLLPNIIEHPVIQLGASLVGIVIVPLNARYRATELAHVIANSEIVGLISTREIDQVDFAGRLQAAFPGLVAGGDPQRLSIAGAPRLRWIMMLGSAAVEDIYLSSEDLAAAGSAVPPEAVVEQSKMLSARDTWALMYTSGTTSLPKACLLTHESVVRNWRVCSRRMGIQSGDVFFDPLPFYHMSGTGPILLALEANGTFFYILHF
jgi:fatty-acyl-CoA synthase